MIPLVLVREGEKVKISRILGECQLRRRMTDLGLRPGMEIEILSTSRDGSLVVRTGGQRVGVGSGLAKRIFVDVEI